MLTCCSAACQGCSVRATIRTSRAIPSSGSALQDGRGATASLLNALELGFWEGREANLQRGVMENVFIHAHMRF